MATKLKIVGTIFNGKDMEGDFLWMIKQMIAKSESNALFLYNGNVFDELYSPNPGQGSAAIRPYNQKNSPNDIRSAPINTGWTSFGGFKCLGPHETLCLQNDFQLIRRILAENSQIDTIYFSCAPEDPTLIGTSIFNVSMDVRKKISEMLFNLPNLEQVLPVQKFKQMLVADYAKVCKERDRSNCRSIDLQREKEENGKQQMPITGYMTKHYFLPPRK